MATFCSEYGQPSHQTNRLELPGMDELPERVYNCSQCPYRTESSILLNSHKRNHIFNVYAAELMEARAQETAAEAEGMELTRNGQLYMSTYIETTNGFQCNRCSYKAKYKLTMKKHMSTHSTNGEINWFQCNHCPYRAEGKPSLEIHNRMKHATAKETIWFQCNHCPFQTRYKTNLKRHILLKHENTITEASTNLGTHKEIKWFPCTVCSYQARRKSTLREHMTFKHTADEDINWFQCDDCSYRGKRKQNLNRHMFNMHNTIVLE